MERTVEPVNLRMPGRRVKIAAKSLRVLGTLGVAIVPAATIIALIRVLFGTTVFHSFPSRQGVWNDEIYYWHQIASFKARGFASGYYTYQELVGAGFSRFGAHGPILPMVYGTIGRITGWQLYSLAVFHLVAITLAAWCFLYCTRLGIRRMVLTVLLLATFWPLMLFAATGMQEGVHYAIALILATFFWRIVVSGEALLPPVRIACLAFLTVASLIRPTWSVLFLPLFLYTGGRSLRALLFSLAKAAAMIVLVYLAFSLITVPYPYGWLGYLRLVPSLAVKLDALRGHALGNWSRWLDSTYNVQLELLQHYQIVIALLILGLVGIVRAVPLVLSRVRARAARDDRFSRMAARLAEVPLVLHAVNLGAIFVATIIFYDIGAFRDYRVLAPHLLLSLLVAIAHNKRFLLGFSCLIVASNLLATPLFIRDYRDWRRDAFTYDQNDLAAMYGFNQTLNQHIGYSPGGEPWCNTLLSSFPQGTGLVPLPPIMLAVPAGIGISVDYGLGIEVPLKSRYVLSTPENAERLGKQTRLRFLTSTQYYNLYLNLDARCE